MKPHEYVKHVRKLLGMSQAQFAEFLDMGHRTITRYEGNAGPIPRHFILAMERLEDTHKPKRREKE
jgi:transcriptional regulator with XRE-family HTH domain